MKGGSIAQSRHQGGDIRFRSSRVNVELGGDLQTHAFRDTETQKRLAKCESLIAHHLQTHPALAQKAQRLQEAPGVNFVGAVTLLAELPELGTGSQARMTSLAGLAPRDHDSGVYRGPRRVYGGRPKVRRILYLCALSAVRHHPSLKTFYTRLRQAGKAPKLALIAAARKLLTYLHSALKNPQFKLA